ncbi:MAG: hypothetical protein ACM3Q2_13790 [Syntrophothermus sp.]
MKFIYRALLVLVFCSALSAQNKTENNFEIRGVLPWHNFLSGPSAWDLKDYENYLDELQKEGINFIGFHNYTGGGERYASYVEPMIKIKYKNVLPEACFDNSSTARWGYTPMNIQDFAFSTSEVFKNYKDVFGADCSVTSRSKEEHYLKAQQMMKSVMDIAHSKGIKFAMGFEFGVHPPEYFSLRGEAGFYWPGQANMIPNPADYQSVQILYAALDNILEAYPGIDYIWLWLNEHSFMGVNLDQALGTPSFKQLYDKYNKYFEETGDDRASRFIGAWSLSYIQLAQDYLKMKNSSARLMIGGWGGGNQLPLILKGLDRGLSRDIIFSLLNPNLGQEDPPAFLGEISKNRDVISVPWLEGDHQLWQLQPRVELMKKHVKLAREMKLQGVAAIHWRTEETKLNFLTFARTAGNSEYNLSTKEIYYNWLKDNCGEKAAAELAVDLAAWDIEKWYCGKTEEYYGYNPQWGRLDASTRKKLTLIADKIGIIIKSSDDKKEKDNLKWIRSKIVFNLLLDETGRAIEPAWLLRSRYASGTVKPGSDETGNARKMLESAPVKELFETFASAVRSKGELGELSSMNQKLWREYLELQNFLKQ